MTERPRARAPLSAPTRTGADGTRRSYVRFAALGDSVTHGLGDPRTSGYRGWARILARAMAEHHDLSLLNAARPGATAADVLFEQLPDALDHRPHLVSLVAGLNDTMRSTWNRELLRADLLSAAAQLADQGALLLTARFHDHSQVLRLPRLLARPMRERIAVLNEVYDEIHERFDGVQVDLAQHPGVYDREFWSIDRLHPSELGHRALADEFAALLEDRGLSFARPGLDLDGLSASKWDETRWLVAEGIPWLKRRVCDLAPHATRALLARTRQQLMH